MPQAVAWSLVSRAADGDAAARRRLVEETIDDLWALAMRLTRQGDRADDVVQETYARVLPTLGRLEPTGRFEGYLARTATNLVLERWRGQRPTVGLPKALSAPEALEPWRQVARAEDEQRRLAAVWEAARRLGPEPRAALLLYYAQELPVRDIAEVLDAPVGTVKTWLHRARHEVRRTALALLNGQAGPSPAGPGEAP